MKRRAILQVRFSYPVPFAKRGCNNETCLDYRSTLSPCLRLRPPPKDLSLRRQGVPLAPVPHHVKHPFGQGFTSNTHFMHGHYAGLTDPN